MQIITLTCDGGILDGDRPAGKDPLIYLGCQVVLEPGYTLRSFFRLFTRKTELSRLSEFVPACMEQYRACPNTGCTTPEFDRLELSKTIEMVGFPGDPRLEIFTSFQGIKGDKTGELKFIPLNSLVDMTFSLGQLKHIIFGDKVDVLEFDTVYTLFEFIDGVLWELSFHGTPDRCEIRRQADV